MPGFERCKGYLRLSVKDQTYKIFPVFDVDSAKRYKLSFSLILNCTSEKVLEMYSVPHLKDLPVNTNLNYV